MTLKISLKLTTPHFASSLEERYQTGGMLIPKIPELTSRIGSDAFSKSSSNSDPNSIPRIQSRIQSPPTPTKSTKHNLLLT
ncbi:Multicopper oxidase abr1 [Venturia inaequalis]|nr:Multicopper oxidase abr1 [Venturia inaequalis]